MQISEFTEAKIHKFEDEIRKRTVAFQTLIKAWMRLPGVQEATAWSLLAEMGRT